MSFTDAELVKAYPGLFAFSLSLLKASKGAGWQERDDAVELTHDGIVRMLQFRDSFTPVAGATLETWGCKIIQRVFYDRYRFGPGKRSKLLEFRDELPDGEPADGNAEPSLVLQDAIAAINKLSKVRREALLLSLTLDSYEEIARVTNSEPKNVKTRLYRARKQVAKELDEGMSGDEVRVIVDNGIQTYEGTVPKDAPARCLDLQRQKQQADFWSDLLNVEIPIGRGLVWSVKHA